MSRVKKSVKNISYGLLNNVVNLILGFVSRTIFISVLGSEVLGLNGLFLNLIGILSFADLGIGSAINFSLYKPVSENDTEKIKSLMNLYKKAYRFIALLVTLIGILLLVNIDLFINDSQQIPHTRIYFMFFIFNTATSYLISYKFSLMMAEEKNYIFNNITMITNIVTIVVQVISLLIYKSYFVYLLVATVIGLIQKIMVNIYFNRVYPYLNDKDINKIPKEELDAIIKNIKALIFHKIGTISIHQTDNIIISAFLNITSVGLISNYTLIINSIGGFINIIFNSISSSFGNLIATSDNKKQYEVFCTYKFFAFWLYGLTGMCLLFLLNPFIKLWLGENMLISNLTVFLIVLNYYMMGHRVCVNNVKNAAGIFNDDKYIAIIQAIVNIVASIYFVKLIGLPGVFLGTVIQGAIASIFKPIILYNIQFKVNFLEYFKDEFKYSLSLLVSFILIYISLNIINLNSGILGLLIDVVIITVIYHIVLVIMYYNSKELQSIKATLFKLVKGV